MIHTSKRIIIVSGPTASGKTAFAINLAKHLNGVIINADSLQLFHDLPLLTARPTKAEEESIPHYLYGFLKAHMQPTAMDWIKKVDTLLEAIPQSQKIIMVGGTGLYINAFLNGLAPIPVVSDSMYNKSQKLALELKENFYDFVVEQDPSIKNFYHRNDIKRLSRALSIFLETNQSISHFLKLPHINAHKDMCYNVYLKPERKILHERIEKRFEMMLEQGVIKEIKTFIESHDIRSKLPVLNAVGAKEIIKFLKGELSYNQMVEMCIFKTRQYAKRQYTWFNQQIDHDQVINPQL